VSRRALLAILGLLAVATPAWGQDCYKSADPVIETVCHATSHYQDRATAEADGYRRIGPDIPAMGEHWVQLGLLLDPAIDVERPEILAYVPVDGRPRLVGIAWAVALQGNEEPPGIPGVEALWHAHDGPVEEELLQVDHVRHEEGTGSRIAVLHAWVWSPSPAGTYASENWALPAIRLGLPPESERDDEAARALSLARGGHAFLSRQVALLAQLDDDMAASATRILANAGTMVDDVVAGLGQDGLTSDDRLELTAIWRDARERITSAARPEEAPMVRAILGKGSGRAN
jgi:hypothetical protein